jgi:Putative auto-transporter adhesin, head GIN domain
MLLHAPDRRAASTLAVVLMVVVVIAAFSLLVATALFLRPLIPVTGPGPGAEVAGSGRVVTKELQFTDFTTVHIGSAFQARITHSSSYRVSVTMDDNLFDYLQVSKEGGALVIGLKPGYEYHYQSLTLRTEIQFPDLNELQMGGATRGTVQGFSSSHKFALLLSGASSVEIADTSAGDIEIDISGASRLSGSMTAIGEVRFTVSGAGAATLGGKANNLLIVGSGASHVDLSDFTVHDARVNLSGASQATINLDGRLDADLSGASTLLYIGNPTLGDISVTGGSTISKK